MKTGRSLLGDLSHKWDQARGETDREVVADLNGTSSGHSNGLRRFLSEFSKFTEGAKFSFDRALDVRADQRSEARRGGSASQHARHDRGAVAQEYETTWTFLKGAIKGAIKEGLKSTDALRDPEIHGRIQRYLGVFLGLKALMHEFNAGGGPSKDTQGYGPPASAVPPLPSGHFEQATAAKLPRAFGAESPPLRRNQASVDLALKSANPSYSLEAVGSGK